MKKYQTTDLRDSVLIIGGGAAGLMAACRVLELGCKAVIFEQNRSEKQLESESFYDNAYLGKKLLITGKGRCNLTNDCTREEFMKNIPHNGKFLFASYSALSPQELMEFFEARGLSIKTERGGRVFPESDKALDVLKILKKSICHPNCTVINQKVTSIGVSDGHIDSIITENGQKFSAEKVIVCTGGLSYPVTGSTGDGYRFAKDAGHSVTELVPSLVPLTSPDSDCKRMQGLSLRNITLSLVDRSNGKKIFSELGEMMFTHFGVTGPLVLSASAHIEKHPSCYFLSVDLKPGLDESKLDARLLSDFGKNPNKDLRNILGGLLPSKMIPVFISKSGIPSDIKANSITKAQRAALVSLFKHFEVPISDFRPIDEAIVTRGGVMTSEINPSTMESRIVGGLYFAGEVIDVDGYTGGFNLQIAFSTATLAANSATKNIS